MILGIDTSLGTAVAVIDDDGVIRSEAARDDRLGHAEAIGVLLTQALAEASVSAGDLTAVAAGMGPGPFTGLRIGIAAARAFALGRGLPVIPVVSHDAIALEAALSDPFAAPGPLAVVTDARRREDAFSLYDGIDDDGLPVRVSGPMLMPHAEQDAIEGRPVLRARRLSAAMVALAAARARVVQRVIGPDDALYLRSPDVSPPAPRKKVGA